jgi:hypothetical protein
VPATSFAEPDNKQGSKSIWTWFAQDETRPVFFFAGIWREWEGDRGTKAAPDVGKHLVFSFLTTDASHDVAPVHSDARALSATCFWPLFNEYRLHIARFWLAYGAGPRLNDNSVLRRRIRVAGGLTSSYPDSTRTS